MKTIFTTLTVVFFTACNAPEKKTTEPTVPTTDISAPVKSCYQYVNRGDTVILNITQVNAGNSVSGMLTYKLKEKDKNEGTIQGSISNDVLLADYVFMSEGTTSTRQVAFKLQDKTFIEGYGEMKEQDNKMIFKNTDSLNFSESIKLVQAECL